MSQFLLVVDGLAASGADVVMSVTEVDYKAAMFGLSFTQPVHGYVWCNKHHDWVLADEAMICQRCLEDILMREAALIEFEQTLAELDEQFEAGFGAQVDAWLDAGASWLEIVEQYGEDVALANADMLYRDAEASWYRFMVS